MIIINLQINFVIIIYVHKYTYVICMSGIVAFISMYAYTYTTDTYIIKII